MPAMSSVKSLLWRSYVNVTPASLRSAVDIRRRKAFWDKEGLLFIHVPKAAGTSISRALYGRSLGHFYASDIRAAMPGSFDRWFKFALVRNPWARLLSAYEFARAGRTASAGVFRHEAYLRDPRFASFERFVMEWLPQADLDSEDNIFREQWRYLCDLDGNLIVDHVGRVEEIDATVELISRRLGRKITVGRDNVLGSGEGYRERYTAEMARRVRDIYRLDIRLFGYRF